MRTPRLPLRLSAWLLLPCLVFSITLDCADVVVSERDYNFASLGGPRVVHWIQETPPSLSNFTFTIDLCHPLKRKKNVPKEDECPSGTRVCGIEYNYNLADGSHLINKVVPIAGDYTIHNGRPLSPHWTRLRDSDSSADTNRDGIRLEMGGGKYPFDKAKGTPQKAIVELLCDPDRTGNEGEESESGDKADREGTRRDKGDEPDDKNPNYDEEKSLNFISYKPEGDAGAGVLRLEWRTKFACEGQANTSPSTGSTHWGISTWFIIILFMAVSAYLIFGSWLNYNRYGARGWDLLPHGDAVRDIPYLLKDWTRRVINTFSGDTRGGYSAV